MAAKPLIGKIALVTGASRGIGKGIALQLGEAGAKIYITGRTLNSKNGVGSLLKTAEEIKKRGGDCIPVQVNHENDKEIENLFDRINTEQNGKLDILVNNAFKGGEEIFKNVNSKFWEIKPEIWDEINNVGLRNHYFCSVYAARMMVPRKSGLIVNITSMGGLAYAINCAYGIGKAAVDRMVVDCGIELKKHNVAFVGLQLGTVKTEFTCQMIKEKGDDARLPLDPNSMFLNSVSMKKMVENSGESPEFAGKCIVSLVQNPSLMKYTSKIVNAADYAQSNGIRDIDESVVPSPRQISSLVTMAFPQLSFVNKVIPRFVKVPQFIMDIATSKF